MNKKGFTLVELLAVIILLTLLGVFTVSTILDKTEEKRNKIDAATEIVLKTAAQSYVAKNADSFVNKSGNVYCLEISAILSSEEIEDINANSEKPISETKTYVKVTFLQENVKYDVVTDCTSNTKILPNSPILASNMIPIKWDKNNNIVLADVGAYGDWYNYDEGRWANALIVPQALLSKFKSLQPGELIIPFNEIVDEAIFVVWIPRFKYTSRTVSGKFKADITFTSGTNGNAHSAFGDNSGFWISKFELTTLNSNVTTTGSALNSSYSQKPYTASFSNLKSAIDKLYTSGYNFISNELELKMVDNDEWAATSFLAHSDYGIATEKLLASDVYTGTIANFSLQEVVSRKKYVPTKLSYGINHYANYTSEIYYSESSIFSSTTRNVNGVYGLSGGINEWVKAKGITASNLDEALTNSSISGQYDSYAGNYITADETSTCLSRGGGTSNNGIFAYESQECSKLNSTRLIINIK